MSTPRTELDRPRSDRPAGSTGEEGQAMVFAVITMLFVFVMIFATYRAGWVSHRKMQLQNAADIAAYAGASVEANNVSMMAFINRGQAFIYYNMMRYSVDCSVWALFKEFKDHEGWMPMNFVNMVDFIGYFGHRTAPDEWISTETTVTMIGESNISTLLSDAKERYDDEVEKGLEWIRDLYDFNRAMAEATPMLVRREVYNVATANGAQRVCMFPDVRAAPGASNQGRRMTKTFEPVDDANGNQDPYIEHEEDLDRWAYDIAVDWGHEDKMPLVGITLPMHPGVDHDGLLGFGRTMPIPEWFDAEQGETFDESDYYQIRECWNERDLGHSNDKSHLAAGGWLFRMNPAGHYHHVHSHFKMFGSIPVPWWGFPGIPYPISDDQLGHDGDNHWHALSGWDFYTPVLPPGGPDGYIHHAVLLCTTCFRTITPLEWDADFDSSTDVMYELDDTDISGDKYTSLPIRDYWPHEQPSKYAPPLVLGEAFFKYGINVGVWQAPGQTGNWLPDAEWGYFCVSSAKSGPMGPIPEMSDLETYDYERAGDDKTGMHRPSYIEWFENNEPDRVIVFRADTRQNGQVNRDYQEFLRSSYNLYYIPWGAKLVPVKDALYDRNASFLMKHIANGIWMSPSQGGWRDVVGDLTVNTKLLNMRMGGAGLPFNYNAEGPLDSALKH